MAEWQRFIERDAVLAGNARPEPQWVQSVPMCHEACPYHDGKRCELLGLRPYGHCEPVNVAMGNLVEATFDAIKESLEKENAK